MAALLHVLWGAFLPGLSAAEKQKTVKHEEEEAREKRRARHLEKVTDCPIGIST